MQEHEKTLENVADIEKNIAGFLTETKGNKYIGDVRNIGAVGVIELVEDKVSKTPFGIKERIGLQIYKEGLKNNLLLRPLGNIIYFFLPLVTQNTDLEVIYAKTKQVLSAIL